MKITISISDDINNWLDSYCKEQGHKKSTYISFLIQRQKEERESMGVGNSTGPIPETGSLPMPVNNTGWSPTTKPSIEELREKMKINKATKSSGFCTHFITKGGRCLNCPNSIAK